MPWHAKPTGSYSYTTPEFIDNSMMIYQVAAARGFSKKAVAAMIGNSRAEGG